MKQTNAYPTIRTAMEQFIVQGPLLPWSLILFGFKTHVSAVPALYREA